MNIFTSAALWFLAHSTGTHDPAFWYSIAGIIWGLHYADVSAAMDRERRRG